MFDDAPMHVHDLRSTGSVFSVDIVNNRLIVKPLEHAALLPIPASRLGEFMEVVGVRQINVTNIHCIIDRRAAIPKGGTVAQESLL